MVPTPGMFLSRSGRTTQRLGSQSKHTPQVVHRIQDNPKVRKFPRLMAETGSSKLACNQAIMTTTSFSKNGGNWPRGRKRRRRRQPPCSRHSKRPCLNRTGFHIRRIPCLRIPKPKQWIARSPQKQIKPAARASRCRGSGRLVHTTLGRVKQKLIDPWVGRGNLRGWDNRRARSVPRITTISSQKLSAVLTNFNVAAVRNRFCTTD
jgi:hypothetical protein